MEDTRILGLDFGTKTVGVAISDPLLLMAQELETITRDKPNKIRKTLARIKEICEEYKVSKIVLGYPINMDDSEGFRCDDTILFKSQVENRTQLPVVLWNEQLTTVAADEISAESGIPKSERKKYIDQIAAAIILQEYLDSNR